MIAGILVFLVLVYLLILQDSSVDDSREIRCVNCGHTRRGIESGANLLAWFGATLNGRAMDDAQAGVSLHVVERTEGRR